MQNDGCIYLVPVCIDGYFGGILGCNGVRVCVKLLVCNVYIKGSLCIVMCVLYVLSA